jgi:hypothetical protein
LIKNNKKKPDYTFDGVYFENIEKIGAFPPIINLKNAMQEINSNIKEIRSCRNILKNEHPQLFEFTLKHNQSFKKFFKLHNNAFLTLEELKSEIYCIRFEATLV